MTNTGWALIRAYFKNFAKDLVGDEFFTIASDSITRKGKEKFGARLDFLLEDGVVVFQLEEAIRRANKSFRGRITDPEIKKYINDIPPDNLPSITQAIKNLPEEVDEHEFKRLVTETFEKDYPLLTSEQRSLLVDEYVSTVNRALFSVSSYCLKTIGNIVYNTNEELRIFRKEVRDFIQNQSYPRTEINGERGIVEGFSVLWYQKLFGVDEALQEICYILDDANNHFIVGLSGQGGIGKSTLADHIAREYIRSEKLFDNFLWISARSSGIIGGGTVGNQLLIDDICRKIGRTEFTFLPESEKLIKLSREFRKAPFLIVLDNLETLGQKNLNQLVEILPRMVDPTKFLLTSRLDIERPPAFSIFKQYVVRELEEKPSLELAGYVAKNLGVENLQADALYKLVGGNPLAIILSVSQMLRFPKEAVLKNLRQASQEEIFDYIFTATWMALSENAKDVINTINLHGGKATLETLEERSNKTITELMDSLRQLINFSMVDYEQNDIGEFVYYIHQLTSTYLRNLQS